MEEAAAARARVAARQETATRVEEEGRRSQERIARTKVTWLARP